MPRSTTSRKRKEAKKALRASTDPIVYKPPVAADKDQSVWGTHLTPAWGELQ